MATFVTTTVLREGSGAPAVLSRGGVMVGRAAHYEDRARSVSYDMLAHRTQEQPVQARASVRADDDDVGFDLAGNVADDVRGIAHLYAPLDRRVREPACRPRDRVSRVREF